MTSVAIKTLDKLHKSQALEIIKKCYPGEDALYEEFSSCFNAYKSFPGCVGIIHYIGAFIGDRLVGIAGYSHSTMSEECWELSWACVLPEEQGKGIGKLLLAYRIAAILEKSKTGKIAILISTTPSRLYLDAGFQILFSTETETILIKQFDREIAIATGP